jgi:hypothetical protein
VTHQLATSSSDERLTAQEIDRLLDELGGLEHVLTDAAPAEKAPSTTLSGSASSTNPPTTSLSPQRISAVSSVVSEDRLVRYGQGNIGARRACLWRPDRCCGEGAAGLG